MFKNPLILHLPHVVEKLDDVKGKHNSSPDSNGPQPVPRHLPCRFQHYRHNDNNSSSNLYQHPTHLQHTN